MLNPTFKFKCTVMYYLIFPSDEHSSVECLSVRRILSKREESIFCPGKLILIQEYERWSVGIDFSGETDTSPAVKICHPPYDSN